MLKELKRSHLLLAEAKGNLIAALREAEAKDQRSDEAFLGIACVNVIEALETSESLISDLETAEVNPYDR